MDTDPLKVPVASLINPEKSGFLTKQGGLVKNWRRRFFVLKSNYLYYYKDKSDSEAQGLIKLTKNSTINDVSKKVGKKHCFEIGTLDRTYYLYSDTLADMENWLNILALATNKLQKTREINNIEQSDGPQKIRVAGLMCDSCTKKLKTILESTQGVENFEIDEDQEIIELNGNISLNELFDVLWDQGFIPSKV